MQILSWNLNGLKACIKRNDFELLRLLRTRMERSLADSPSFLVQFLTHFRMIKDIHIY